MKFLNEFLDEFHMNFWKKKIHGKNYEGDYQNTWRRSGSLRRYFSRNLDITGEISEAIPGRISRRSSEVISQWNPYGINEKNSGQIPVYISERNLAKISEGIQEKIVEKSKEDFLKMFKNKYLNKRLGKPLI